MDPDDALAFVCGPVCLEVQTVDTSLLRPPAVLPVDPAHPLDPDRDLFTWLVKGGRFLMLMQTTRGTRVYDTEDDMLYHAAPHAQLAPECPPGHAFLCQTVQDAQADGALVPRLLVTDLVAPRIECPVRRGEAVRGMAHLLPAICHIQWAGHRTALERFVQSGSVPHKVAGLVALRAPLQLVHGASTGIAALDALDLTI